MPLASTGFTLGDFKDFLKTVLATTAALCLSPTVSLAANGRLPGNISPLHYDLTVIPAIETSTFAGEVHIDIDVATATPTVVLNTESLTLDRVTIDGAPATGVTQDKDSQTATLTAASPLAPGHHTVDIAYRGVIEKTARGLFQLDYASGDAPAGAPGAGAATAHMLSTQFEAGDARRFLPCWDEPSAKATFSLSIMAPQGQMAVSNMPVKADEAMADGRHLVHFQQTPRMSSYLLFVGVGDLERATAKAGDVEIGAVVRRGSVDKARFALETAAAILARYNDYFGTPYPLPKLDFVAIPGAGGFGAMENWGAIMSFEKDMLLDPALATEAARQRVFQVVAHEMAHQWFGDLVTMAWWDDLWLNEGFASWMETKAMQALHPDWSPWLVAMPAMESAKRLDARASTHPVVQPINSVAEADEAFDDITYDKGQAVIRMVEATVGETVFRDGVRRYMKRNAYGNATTRDLWKAVEEAGGKDVLRIATDFITKPGIPLVSVSATCGASGPAPKAHPAHKGRKGAPEPAPAPSGGTTQVSLRQSRFATEPVTIPDQYHLSDRLWAIPVPLATVGDGAPAHTLLTALTGKAAVPGCGPLLANAGQTGYFRVAYTEPAFKALVDHVDRLAPIDQLGLMYDSAALGEAGQMAMSDSLALIRALPVNADPAVWQQAADYLRDVDDFYAGGSSTGGTGAGGISPAQAAFRAFARGVLAPALSAIGWDPQPGQGDKVGLERTALISALGSFDDPNTLTEARHRLASDGTDPTALPPAIRLAVITTVAQHADAATFDRLHALASSTTDPLARRQLYGALGAVRDPVLAQKVLDLSLTPEAGTTLAPQLILAVADANPDLAWRFITSHVDAVEASLDQMQRYEFFAGVARRSADPARIDELNAYAEAHVPVSGRQGIAKAVGAIAYRAKVARERLPQVDAWLATLPTTR
ncbi:M1 family metallopeptidase [Nitrospirillum pindoramense]|uniref:Aminopeptidase n=1 Tax=Nitrospirillum amazonense TaxID=28077 RepID=A0A560GVW4_9PROT|nr:M1 family metallopeptidase [Nitrospirillum amazonense]TWB38177.1 aminopeptidase N [Nitrospirillum amazonense]